jgi:hypothetical protein
VNFAKRDKCNRCATAKPGGEKKGFKDDRESLNVGPPGLFKKGDWTCTM